MLLGIIAPFLEERHKAQIEETAAKYGVEIRYLENSTVPSADGSARGDDIPPAAFEDLDILFGNIKPEVLSYAKSLKWFACSWAGVDKVLDRALYASPEAILTNSSGCYGVTISEAIIMMILMLYRTVPRYTELMRNRGWGHLGPMRTLQGSVATVVGCGDIGRNTARRLKGMGAVEVRGVRRSAAQPDADFDKMYQTADLAEACKDTDLLILCVPGTDETKTMISKEIIDGLNPKTIIVNVGRGSAIDQPALIDALNEGRLAGAALDVMVPEPLPADHPLWDAKNALLFPHVSGMTSAAVTRDLIVDKFVRNLSAFMEGRPMEGVVDIERGY